MGGRYLMLGENSFGWRFSSVFFGVLVVLVAARLAEQLFADKRLALLAAFLASLDGLLLVQSRVAMNDIHVTFFILLTLLCYARFRGFGRKKNPVTLTTTKIAKPMYLLATGLAAGLAVASKWSGMFVLGTILLFELVRFGSLLAYHFQRRTVWKKFLVNLGGQILTVGLALGVLPAVIYISSYWHMFFQGKSLHCTEIRHEEQLKLPVLSWFDERQTVACNDTTCYQLNIPSQCYFETFKQGEKVLYKGFVSHFVALHKQIWWYQTHLTAQHTYQSRPWQWFLNLRPVWYYVEYGQNERADIYAFGNPALFWLGAVAVVASGGFIVWRFWTAVLVSKKNDKKIVLTPLVYILVAYGLVWLPWQLSPRIMFFYHYTPAVPLMAIILSYWLVQIWGKTKKKSREITVRKGIVIGLVAVMFVAFIVWYPHWTGMMVQAKWKNGVYFRLESWK